MKKTVIAVLLSGFLVCGTFSIKIVMADTANRQKVEEVSYDSPLMSDSTGSLSKLNLQDYDVKDSEPISKEVNSYNTDKNSSVYGISVDDIKLDDVKSDSNKNKTDKQETKTHTNLPMDENDANYQAPDITYYAPDGSAVQNNDDTTGDQNSDSYSDYKYTYSTLAKSVMLQALKGNKEFSQASKTRQEVILYAMQYIGNKYVFGGESITDGIDCSAFTRYVMKHFGKKLPRNSYSQRSSGTATGKPNTGDLICYSGHVAIYIGDGKIIHASNHRPYPRGGIKVSSSYRYRKVISIRSLFND